MSSSGVSFANLSQTVLLRWCDRPGSPSHEQMVEIIQSRHSEAVIRSFLNFDAETEVHLIGKNYSANGIVRSSFLEGPSFVVTITMHDRLSSTDPAPRDPGLFAVENFLTKEAEDRILDEFDNEPTQGTLSRCLRFVTIFVTFFNVRSFFLSAI